MADQQRKPSETSIVRWFCYLGFAICSLLLIATLSFGADWRAPLVGTFIYGVPALAMYRQEETRRENLAVVRGVQQTRGSNFEDSFDDDPTAPPTRKN